MVIIETGEKYRGNVMEGGTALSRSRMLSCRCWAVFEFGGFRQVVMSLNLHCRLSRLPALGMMA